MRLRLNYVIILILSAMMLFLFQNCGSAYLKTIPTNDESNNVSEFISSIDDLDSIHYYKIDKSNDNNQNLISAKINFKTKKLSIQYNSDLVMDFALTDEDLIFIHHLINKSTVSLSKMKNNDFVDEKIIIKDVNQQEIVMFIKKAMTNDVQYIFNHGKSISDNINKFLNLFNDNILECKKDLSPVCGVDGVTYGNLCLATGVEIAHSGHCLETDVACNKEYSPVCGKDGKTYSNKCLAKGVEIAHSGDCLDSEVGCSKEYSPVCGIDGVTYANKCLAKGVEIANNGACKNSCLKIYAPVCGMDNQTYGNLCLAASIGIKYEGVCK